MPTLRPWLQTHIGELDNVLGLGLTNPQREVGAGDFSIDLVAETNFGDVVIENQFGRSDHRHLGQLVTYLSQRDVERAIWIVEEARPEHVKAVETLNERGIGQIWMVAVRAIAIGDSVPAPLFAVVAEPADIEKTVESTELTQSQVRRRDFPGDPSSPRHGMRGSTPLSRTSRRAFTGYSTHPRGVTGWSTVSRSIATGPGSSSRTRGAGGLGHWPR